jgi:hypothetical protein
MVIMIYMEKLEDAKRVIRNRNSWKDRQCNVKRETKKAQYCELCFSYRIVITQNNILWEN